MTPGTAVINGKIPGIPERVPGIFGWGSLPGAAPPCSSAPETSGSVSRPPAPGKSPYRGEFSTFCGSCCGKWKHPSGMPPIKADQLTPVLPAGTVRGRAGRVKSRSVQTFPHFASRPVENRGRAGDREKPAVPVEQPVLNRQTQALWLAASMASIIAARTPASSMARMPRMVVPPGEQTLSLSAPGCRPLSSSILPAPITVWAASS